MMVSAEDFLTQLEQRQQQIYGTLQTHEQRINVVNTKLDENLMPKVDNLIDSTVATINNTLAIQVQLTDHGNKLSEKANSRPAAIAAGINQKYYESGPRKHYGTSSARVSELDSCQCIIQHT